MRYKYNSIIIMESIFIKTKSELLSFTNEMETFYDNIINYIRLITDQISKLICNNEIKITDISNLLNIFVVSLDILLQKKYDRNIIKIINIEKDNKKYILLKLPSYRIKYYKRKLIGKIVFNETYNNNIFDIEKKNYLFGYKTDFNFNDINILNQYLVIIKKRFIKISDYFINKKSELLLYSNNMIMLD